jgi:hypothetical protein
VQNNVAADDMRMVTIVPATRFSHLTIRVMEKSTNTKGMASLLCWKCNLKGRGDRTPTPRMCEGLRDVERKHCPDQDDTATST